MRVDPVPPQLRPDGGVRRGLRAGARTADRDLGRRSAERPARHSRAWSSRIDQGYDIVCGWRKDPQGPVADPAPAVDAGEPADLVGDRRAAARLRVLAEGVSRRGRQAAAAVRRDAPLPARDRERDGRADRGGAGQSPRASARPLEVRDLADDSRDARPADGEVPPELLDAAAADFRADRPDVRRPRRRAVELSGRQPAARPVVVDRADGRWCCSAFCWSLPACNS